MHRAAQTVDVPLCVGGGVTSVERARDLLLAGADKIATNTAALDRPELVSELADRFGRQCVVVAIDAQRENGNWYAHASAGHRRTEHEVVAWSIEVAERGAGELLMTSIDADGTKSGYDLELIERVCDAVSLPVVASGGAGGPADMVGRSARRRSGRPGRVDLSRAHTLDRRGQARGGGRGAAGAAVSDLSIPRLKPGSELVTCVVQDGRSGDVLMVAWADRPALEATVRTGLAHFHSRSRDSLWLKGETSGNTMVVESMTSDCDGDTILMRVRPNGPACHTGSETCFGPRTFDQRLSVLAELAEVFEARRTAAPDGSYVAGMLAGDREGPQRKVGEEAVEVLLAEPGSDHLVTEVADLWFHSMLLLARDGIDPLAPLEELRRRRDK